MILLILVIGAAIYFLGYDKFHTEKIAKEEEIKTIQAEYDQKQGLINKIPELDSQIEQLKMNILNDAAKFYGTVPQETFVYMLQTMADETGMDILKFEFTNEKDSALESFMSGSTEIYTEIEKAKEAEEAKAAASDSEASESTESGNAEASGEAEAGEESASGEEAAVPKKAEPKNEDKEDFAQILIVRIDTEGTFDAYKKFLSIIDNNKERLVVTNFKIEREGNVLEEFFGYDIRPKEARPLKEFFDTYKILKGEIYLKIYLVPSVDRYVEKQNIHEWDMEDSKYQPFEYSEFTKPFLLKTRIHEFEDPSYSIFDQSTNARNEIASTLEGEDTLVSLDYQFSTESKTPNLFLDLTNKNIVIDSAAYEVGLNMFSDNINDAKVNLIVKDATNKEYSIPILEKIYFKGWASVAQKVDSNIKFPITLNRLVISEEGLTEIKNGQIKLDYIYVGKLPVTENANAQNENKPAA